MEEGGEKKGFTIRDRRFSSQPEESPGAKEGKGEEKPEENRPDEADQESKGVFPEIDFSSFLLSLSTSALLHLGELPDPVTRKRGKDLALAKQTIDILGMLRDKTRGNLTPEEERLMENLLTDLRWRYVRENTQKEKSG